MNEAASLGAGGRGGGAVPSGPEEILAAVTPARRALYAIARRAIDAVERAAPWGLLYYPPDDLAELAGRLADLVAEIRAMPLAIAERLGDFPEQAEEGGDPAREEVRFFYDAVTDMVEREVTRLESWISSRPATGDVAAAAESACELAADLKGKFVSAMIGASAALIAQGRWPGLSVELALFPERGEEFHRSRDLAEALNELAATLAEVRERVPVGRWLGRWRAGARVDQYALADLVALRAKVGSLLREPLRRALYSGDYHQIRLREVMLTERVDELERLHLGSWRLSAAGAAEAIVRDLPRLETLALEIAALLDAVWFAELVGPGNAAALRMAGARAREGRDRALAALLARDDLKVFVQMLAGAVNRRAAVALDETHPGVTRAAGAASPPARAAETREPAATQAAGHPSAGALVAVLRTNLAALRDPQNPRWRDFRMVHRLLVRQGRVPVTMLSAALPLVREIERDVLPGLRRLTPYRGLSPEVVARLGESCDALLGIAYRPPKDGGELALKLDRLVRFLEAIESVIAH